MLKGGPETIFLTRPQLASILVVVHTHHTSSPGTHPMFSTHKSTLLVVAETLLLASYAAGATIWNEATQGDLSGNCPTPTALTLTPGSNDLFATTQGGDLEFVAVTVPPGSSMTGLFLRAYTG